MLFTSDNWGGVHPEVMEAMTSADGGFAPAYGADTASQGVRALFSEVFERDVAVAFVPTGSAANGVALSMLTAPYGGVICHEHAHVLIDECGAPEFYTGGAKVIPAGGAFGKMTVETIEAAMLPYDPPMAHRVSPSVLSLTQATEWGTVYSPDEISTLNDATRRYGMGLHMDGARFAGAVRASGASPAELTWKAGVDILSFGATKNGCMLAEAVVLFDPSREEEMVARCKRAGLGMSKQRFLAAQWQAYFADDLWLSLAETSARQCRAVANIFTDHPECEVLVEPQINELFVRMPGSVAEKLRGAGAEFYDWVQPGDQYGGEARRFVTSWETTDEQVQALSDALG
ncbi:low specificity L-threonine aldolase [Parvularcula sp. ZS-1/3]|uniref:Low specificity L-threonine aldolase n=1 Tax=Parvularcula mediterranea TaxID=2732508 RepID=A0A7Y3RKH3_9PROT|nr:low specificity L-threonine aldolase [Parvularcula mediterranea]NNU15723.1 low specificity L-threonine aldolase [Parvularcula mediterranea]